MHPQVHGPGRALKFFGKRKDARTGLDYVRHPAFRLTRKKRKAGHVTYEASPDYVHRPRALAEIRTLLPTVRVVFVLREPVARAYDEFWTHVRAGRLFRADRDLFVCYGDERSGAKAARTADALAAGAPEGSPARAAALASARAGCVARGARIAPGAASPVMFDAYAKGIAQRRRAAKIPST